MTVEPKEVVLEERIIDLETRLAFQEDTIEQLNQELIAQQRQLELVLRRLEAAEDRLKSLQSSVVALPHEETPPPHY
jgi:SlyX protein